MESFVLEKTIKRPITTKSAPNNLRRKCAKIKDLDNLKYNDLLPLYDLWKSYYRYCSGDEKQKIDGLLVKADLHGCLLLVTVADNPSQIGIRGIVVVETKHTFQLISPDDRLLTIPKQGTSFQFVLDDKIFTLFGDALRNTAAGRSQRKFRNSFTVPYLLT